MALFKIHKGKKINLPTTYHEGYCYLTTDDGKFYIDTTNVAAGRIVLNAEKADKLAAARTFQIADNDGTNKGPTASFDGTTNVIINLPSTIKASIIGNAGSASQLGAYSIAGEYTKNTLAYFNASVNHSGTAQKGVNDGPTTTNTWWHFLRFTHANAAGYYTDLAIPFTANSLYYKRITNGTVDNASTNAGWVRVLDALNYTSYCAKANHSHSDYLPLSGGTLTGFLSISTNNRYIVLGCQNESYAHYSTNADSGHWFNTNVRVQGDIYCGSNYDKKVISEAGGYLNNQLISHSVNGGMWISGTHSAAFVVDTATSAAAGNYYQGWYSGKTPQGAWSLGCLAGDESMYFVYGSDADFQAGTNNTAQLRMASSGVLFGAAWNDYAEFRTTTSAKAGEVVIENGDGTMHRSCKRLEPAANIVSDTYGFAIGETKKCGTPIAVAGRVLAHPYEDRYSYKAGDAVCSAPDGKVSKMTREEMVMYPDCIIGYVSEIPEYEIWGQTDVPVNGRIWIRIK